MEWQYKDLLKSVGSQPFPHTLTICKLLAPFFRVTGGQPTCSRARDIEWCTSHLWFTSVQHMFNTARSAVVTSRICWSIRRYMKTTECRRDAQAVDNSLSFSSPSRTWVRGYYWHMIVCVCVCTCSSTLLPHTCSHTLPEKPFNYNFCHQYVMWGAGSHACICCWRRLPQMSNWRCLCTL